MKTKGNCQWPLMEFCWLWSAAPQLNYRPTMLVVLFIPSYFYAMWNEPTNCWLLKAVLFSLLKKRLQCGALHWGSALLVTFTCRYLHWSHVYTKHTAVHRHCPSCQQNRSQSLWMTFTIMLNFFKHREKRKGIISPRSETVLPVALLSSEGALFPPGYHCHSVSKCATHSRMKCNSLTLIWFFWPRLTSADRTRPTAAFSLLSQPFGRNGGLRERAALKTDSNCVFTARL